MPGENRTQRTSAAAQRRRSRALVIFYITAFAAVVIGAVLLCVFVFFRVGRVELKGETGYSESDILSVLSISEGDNLVLLTTAEREAEIEYRFPYIEDVEIVKHIPTTVEVRLTAARTAFSVASGGRYIYVSERGKVLEIADAPAAGSAVVTGGESGVKGPSEVFKFTDKAIEETFETVQTQLAKNELLSHITAINMTNLYDLKMVYEGRIELQFGNTNQLDYKVRFVAEMFNKMLESGEIGPATEGVIDLSVVPEKNKGFFREGALSSAGSSSASGGDPIPSTPYTGEDTDGTDTDTDSADADADAPQEDDDTV